MELSESPIFEVRLEFIPTQIVLGLNGGGKR